MRSQMKALVQFLLNNTVALFTSLPKFQTQSKMFKGELENTVDILKM